MPLKLIFNDIKVRINLEGVSLVKGAASPEMVKSCHNDQLGVEEGVGSYRRHFQIISGGFRSQLPTKGVIKSSPTTNSLQAIMM